MANLKTEIPLIDAPFVNDTGHITEAWFIFLLQMFRRTGGATGGDGQLTVGDVLGLEADIPVPFDISQQASQLSIFISQVAAMLASSRDGIPSFGEVQAQGGASGIPEMTMGVGSCVDSMSEMTFARV